jgi:hypothetical protein
MDLDRQVTGPVLCGGLHDRIAGPPDDAGPRLARGGARAMVTALTELVDAANHARTAAQLADRS